MLDCVDPGVHGVFIAPQDMAPWVERIRPHILQMAAASGGRYEAPDLFVELGAGRMHLWIAVDGPGIAAVMLTQVVVYPRRRALRCIGIVGCRARRWMHLLHDVERMAQQTFGCDLMEALHTPGHERLLSTGGWHSWHVLSEKEL